MMVITEKISDRQLKIKQLETLFETVEKDEQKLMILAELAGYYTFTNIREAQKLLADQAELLTHYHFSDAQLSYHLNVAIVENQLYNYELSDIEFKKALELVRDSGLRQQTEVYIDYAGTLMNLKEKEQAMYFLDAADKNLTAFPDDTLKARMMCREAYFWLMVSAYDKAIELFLQSEKMYDALDEKSLEIKDLYFKSLIYSGLGSIYDVTNDLQRAVGAHLKVINMCEQAGMRSRLAWHYVNVGKAYMGLDDYENAEAFFKKVNLINDDLSQPARAHASANSGYCYFLGGKYEEALSLYKAAEKLYRTKDDKDYLDNLSVVSHWKGMLYDAVGKKKLAEKQYANALHYAQAAGNHRQQGIVCKDIAELFADKGDYKNAYDYQVLHDQFWRKHTEEMNRFRVSELEYKYEAENKRKETELLRLQATGLQLKALRAQMNPHFMYNALNSIQNYIMQNDTTHAAKYLAKFAKLMRKSLEYSELEIISLEDEIAFLEDYIIINQKLRFENQLEYIIEVDEEIEEDILGVPTMIVQPYLENAIEHGLRPRRGGLIKLSFSLINEDKILCIVEDNGVGREKVRKMQEKDGYHLNHKSRGTNITEKRLEILHAHSAKEQKLFVNIIDLRDSVTLEPTGTRVEIQIPVVEMRLKNVL
jgi:two-component system, LytTR family, sensor kinase